MVYIPSVSQPVFRGQKGSVSDIMGKKQIIDKSFIGSSTVLYLRNCGYFKKKKKGVSLDVKGPVKVRDQEELGNTGLYAC